MIYITAYYDLLEEPPLSELKLCQQGRVVELDYNVKVLSPEVPY